MEIKLGPGCFYGELSRSCEVAGLRLTEITYPSEHKTPEHSHKQAYFSLTLKGTHTKRYGAKVVRCTPQTLVFHPPNQKQSGCSDVAGGSAFAIEVGTQILGRLRHHGISEEKLAVFRDGTALRIAAKLYHEFRHMDELSALAIEGLSLEMLVETSRRRVRGAERKPPRWLERAKEMLHTCFTENLTVAAVAAAVGVHPVHLAGEFRRFYGSAPAEYVRRLRVEFACRQISTTEAPLTDIALAAGFSSHSHFSTTFKHLTGMTPTEYRATFRTP